MPSAVQPHKHLLANVAALVVAREISEAPFIVPPFMATFHGGAFWEGIGTDFSALGRRDEVINADVLDAWFPPSPKVREALAAACDWAYRTSPPTYAEGMVAAISESRGIRPDRIWVGSGSSSLIFLALREWLSPLSRVLILDPTYGEYAHVLETVVGARMDRYPLHRTDDFQIDVDDLVRRCKETLYDFVALVNPNSPTGRYADTMELAKGLARIPSRTRVWVDETYIDYVVGAESIEQFLPALPNLTVCKSLSKTLALSGLRTAYLAGFPSEMAHLRKISPPWAVSLPAQIATVVALNDPCYYRARYEETGALRTSLELELRRLNVAVVPGCANFCLGFTPYPASALIADARGRNVFLRDSSSMGQSLGENAVRFAVKDQTTQAKMLQVVGEVLEGQSVVV